MTVKELKKLLAKCNEDALVTINFDNVQFCSVESFSDFGDEVSLNGNEENFACYIYNEDNAKMLNQSALNNLKADGVKVVYNEDGDEFTIDELEESLNHPVLKMGKSGAYYFS